MEITVRTKQYLNNDTDIIEENGVGKVKQFKGGKLIFYKPCSAEDDATVTISIKKNEVKVKRSGLVRTTMLYRVGEITSFCYSLPYGSTVMEIETEKMSDTVSESGGELRLVYTLRINGERFLNDTHIIIGAAERN